MTKVALIDGDIILYSVGFASEERYYLGSDGECYDKAKDVPAGVEKELIREPVEDFVWKGNANTLIRNIQEGAKCSEYRIFLTGAGNFREELTDTYKANRKNATKPLMYNEMKKWLTERHKAETVTGMEADDKLAMLTVADPTNAVLCSLDKDLDMVPGTHYNWRRDDLYTVTHKEGQRWFFTQLLTGDPVDNIVGLKGVGPAKASKILDGLDTTQEMYDACVTVYEDQGRPLSDVHLNAQLLWMIRHEGVTWEEELGVKYVATELKAGHSTNRQPERGNQNQETGIEK